MFFVFFSATATLFRANQIDENKHYFKEMLKANLKFGIFLEFLYGLYTFSFETEFLAVPLGVALAILVPCLEKETNLINLKKGINTFLSFLALYLLYHVIAGAIDHKKELFVFDNLKQILLSPIYTILFIPFLYLLSMHLVYEVQNIILDTAIKVPALRRAARNHAICCFWNDLQSLKRWVKCVRFDNPQTERELMASIKNFKLHLEFEKSPPQVCRYHGWSPYQAVGFMASEKLKAGNYDRAFDDKWAASSGHLYIGNKNLVNTLHYNVNGNVNTAWSLELALKVFSPNEPSNLHVKFLSHVNNLFRKAAGHDLPRKIALAVLQGKPKMFNYKHYEVVLNRVRWHNLTNGYDLVFTLSIKNQNILLAL